MQTNSLSPINKMTSTAIDADYLATESDDVITQNCSPTQPTQPTLTTIETEDPPSPRQNNCCASTNPECREPAEINKNINLRRFITEKVAPTMEQRVIPSIQSGTRTVLQSPALLIGLTLRGVGGLVGGNRQKQLDKGAENLNQRAQTAADAVVDAGSQLLSPNNLMQTAALTAGNLYGSPMSGIALLSAVQASQGIPIDTKLLASNAAQAYSGGISKRVSQAMGAGVTGAIVGGAASGALCGAASATAAALTSTSGSTKEDASKTVVGATVRGAMSAAMELAVNPNLTNTSETDSIGVTLGKQAVRNSVLGAGKAFSQSAQAQLIAEGQLDPNALVSTTGQALGGALAATLANVALLATTAKATTSVATNQQFEHHENEIPTIDDENEIGQKVTPKPNSETTQDQPTTPNGKFDKNN